MALAVSRACIIEQLACVSVLRIRCVVGSTAVNDVAAHVPKARWLFRVEGIWEEARILSENEAYHAAPGFLILSGFQTLPG